MLLVILRNDVSTTSMVNNGNRLMLSMQAALAVVPEAVIPLVALTSHSSPLAQAADSVISSRVSSVVVDNRVGASVVSKASLEAPHDRHERILVR